MDPLALRGKLTILNEVFTDPKITKVNFHQCVKIPSLEALRQKCEGKLVGVCVDNLSLYKRASSHIYK